MIIGLKMEAREPDHLGILKEMDLHQHLLDQKDLMHLLMVHTDQDQELDSKIMKNQQETLGINIEIIKEEPNKFQINGDQKKLITTMQ